MTARCSVPARRALAVAVMAGLLGFAHLAKAGSKPVEFDQTFLHANTGHDIDVDRFARESAILPGRYLPDIYVNGQWMARTEVAIRPQDGGRRAGPCFNRTLLERLGVDVSRLAPAVQHALEGRASEGCPALIDLVPEATASFDAGEQRLDVTLPQAVLSTRPHGDVDPSQWDAGIDAATLAYSFNTFRQHTAGATATHTYLGLSAGVNLRGWRLRQDSALTQSSGERAQWGTLATYAMHDLPALRSQFLIGDASTSGELFDSTRFRGVRLYSDDRMLPQSMRGYAPVVRGIARTNAQVTVTQGGRTIYQTTVTPGSFELRDLYSMGYGGDLSVMITEADGERSTFTVPYASVPQLMRPGGYRYSLTAGEVRDPSISGHQPMVEVTLQHGWSNSLTGYTGLQGAEGYLAALVGAAVNSPVGSFALDVTQANARIRDDFTSHGRSVRLAYSKLVPQTQTNLVLAAYRYSSSGYYGLREALLTRASPEMPQSHQRSQVQLSLSQEIAGGSLFAVASARSFWEGLPTERQLQFGYSRNLGPVSTSLSLQREQGLGPATTRVLLSFNVPLDRVLPSSTGTPRAASLTTNLVHDGTGTRTQATFNTALDDERTASLGLTADHGPQSKGVGANLQYRGSVATASLAASRGTGFSQASVGVAGALVAHANGITLGTELGESVAIVEAQGAEGASITGVPGLRVDRHGFALVPNLVPYAMNRVGIDSQGLSTDIDLSATTQEVAPRAGAVVMVKFKTQVGRGVIINARLPDGAPVPLGSDVLNERGESLTATGQGGRMFVRVEALVGELSVQWGARTGCRLAYDLSQHVPSPDAPYARLNAVCTPSRDGDSKFAGASQ
jgi:outer membrane usher protein